VPNDARTRGRRAGLTTERVIAAALQLIDREGLDALSMRRLATELGVHAMSLYNHVPSRGVLLDGVVEAVLREGDASVASSGAWDERIRERCRAFRAAALAHPNAFVLVLTRPVLSHAALDVIRAGLSPAIDAGLAPESAVHAMRAFTAFMTGTILREVGSVMTFAAVDADLLDRQVDEATHSRDPVLAAAAPHLAVVDHDAEFDYGIELLIAGLAHEGGLPLHGAAGHPSVGGAISRPPTLR
jgi:AcrR family transcriptional regulator